MLWIVPVDCLKACNTIDSLYLCEYHLVSGECYIIYKQWQMLIGRWRNF